VHWIPGRLPNSRIIAAIERHHGKVHERKLLRDRQGIADGRRLYRLKTDDLKARPIAPTVRLDNMVFLVEYAGQPAQCFLCKTFGHVRMNCPVAVMSPIRDELTPTNEKETTTVNANSHENPPSSSLMDQQPKENHKDESTYQDSIEESDMELDAYPEKLEQKLLSSTPARSETTYQNSDLLNQKEADKEAPPKATMDEEKGNELEEKLIDRFVDRKQLDEKSRHCAVIASMSVWGTVFKTYGSRSSLILRLWQIPH